MPTTCPSHASLPAAILTALRSLDVPVQDPIGAQDELHPASFRTYVGARGGYAPTQGSEPALSKSKRHPTRGRVVRVTPSVPIHDPSHSTARHRDGHSTLGGVQGSAVRHLCI